MILRESPTIIRAQSGASHNKYSGWKEGNTPQNYMSGYAPYRSKRFNTARNMLVRYHIRNIHNRRSCDIYLRNLQNRPEKEKRIILRGTIRRNLNAAPQPAPLTQGGKVSNQFIKQLQQVTS